MLSDLTVTMILSGIFCKTSVDISEISTFRKNENGQYVGITSATADFELVREERAPAICPQQLSRFAQAPASLPRLRQEIKQLKIKIKRGHFGPVLFGLV